MITELEDAIELANSCLDDVSRDPDSDLSMMSRQFLRARERIAELEEQVRCLQASPTFDERKADRGTLKIGEKTIDLTGVIVYVDPLRDEGLP
jgi:hypothetical protein